ncbi:hypothetical protein [Streptomyces boninensis]|uniref:hypothetical protein n=1 Tax=Streptomyces boninensis TaxID=2039455 RepID=UPI003B224FA7
MRSPLPDHQSEGGPADPRPAFSAHRPLALCAFAMALLAVFSLAGVLISDREVLGENNWLKPLKFAISFSLYAATLAWLMSRVRRWRRTLWWSGTAVVVLFLVPETALIVLQAIRGVPSHFNTGTAFDETVFRAMGGAAYIGWLLTALLGLFLARGQRLEPAAAWAVRLGFVVSLAGMSVGYLMTAPTPDQAQALDHGADLAVVGSHTIGADGGGRMPFTGWETGGGDLRVPHFAGVHALQALPLLALGLQRLAKRRPLLGRQAVRTRLVCLGAVAYAGLFALLLMQALNDESVLSPSLPTAISGIGILAGTAIMAALILGTSGRRPATPRPEADVPVR